MSGSFIVVIGLIINTAVFVFALYYLFVIVLNEGDVSTFVDSVNNMFGFI